MIAGQAGARLGTCSACAFTTLIGPSKVATEEGGAPTLDVLLCELCMGAEFGRIVFESGDPDQKELFRALGYVGNAILKAIRTSRG